MSVIAAMIQGPFRAAIPFVLTSAILHLLAPFLGGSTVEALMLLPIGLLCLAVAAGLSHGWRWLGYLAFLGLFIGGIAALASIWTPSPVPSWLFAAITVADWTAVVALFVALWRHPEAT